MGKKKPKKKTSGAKKKIPSEQGNSKDEVGYKKPPKKHQFKPGQSGNPTGLPKGHVGLASRFKKLLLQKGKDGRELADLFVEHFVKEALKGKFSFAKEVLDRVDGKVVESQVDISPDEFAKDVTDMINTINKGVPKPDGKSAGKKGKAKGN